MRLLRYILILTVLLAMYVGVMVMIYIPYMWIAGVIMLVALLKKKTHLFSAYGTARWCESHDLEREGMTDEGNGLIVGHFNMKSSLWAAVKGLVNPRIPANRAVRRAIAACQRRRVRSSLVRLNKSINVSVFAPPGAGKGVSIVIVHLLTCPDSMVVTDPKGELFKATSNVRWKMGHKVICIDPFGVVQGADKFNPLLSIDPQSRTALDECRDIAQALVMRTGTEPDPHWNDRSEKIIATFIGFVVAFGGPNERSLQTVRTLISDPKKYQGVIEACAISTEWGGMLARAGQELLGLKDRELSSVLSTVHRHLSFLDTIAVHDNTCRSTFDPRELLTGRMTIFLVLPPDHLRAQSSLLRLWCGSLLRTCVKGGLQEKKLVRFVLDEAASLGHMEAMDDAISQYRGFGVRLLFIYQSLGQLKNCWPNGQDQTLLGNCSTVFFGVNDPQTADFVSSRLGEKTIAVSSGGTSTGKSYQSGQQGQGSYSYSSNSNDNWSQIGRKLLQSSEVMSLDPRIAITFTPGVPPIATWLCRSYEGDFHPQRRMSLFKILVDTACLMAFVSILAVGVTAVMFDTNK